MTLTLNPSLPLSGLVATFALAAPCLASAQHTARENKPTPGLHRISPQTPLGLQKLFAYSRETLPLVSAHRGGAKPGYPENCIATFEETLRHTFALMEIDPRYTKDGAIVVHHDPTLERTTTGKGRVVDFTLAELKQLRLKDPAGNATPFLMPTLDEVLEWARGQTILVLDQKDVPATTRARKIAEHKAESYAMLIVNSFKDAQAVHALNSNIFMEVMIPTRAKVAEFDQLGVPWRNVVAFVGHTPPEDPKLYELVHERGANCLIGTSRNLDLKFLRGEVSDLRVLEAGYRALLQRGADLIETDIPAALGPMLFGTTPVPASRQECFHAP